VTPRCAGSSVAAIRGGPSAARRSPALTPRRQTRKRRPSIDAANRPVPALLAAQRIEHEPIETYSNGVRHMNVPDPDGNTIAFAEPPDAASAAPPSAATGEVR
jgi:hypothetical protein